ncbi:hypothetical protein PDESU_04188 [Pontiella desulfatans]|uniref:Radical SAM core domain-containing protein n=1 Tax=Pontiella desulfatans TaxID=2750659 RepID=A0A6C2U6S5_PONDE|nr:radical SAM protein [Pontiella desulfatans]VGO15603.1 hypothetical protein PDESU_04188 [Pontiella desulfatans]
MPGFGFVVKYAADRLCGLMPGMKVYPRVLQFPVTSRCNSLCKSCNIPSEGSKIDMSVELLRKLVRDPLLKKTESVGINGGEPSLMRNLPELVGILLELPRIRSFTLITNGLLSDRVLEQSKAIVSQCRERGVRFSLSVSLDGVGEIHDECRGIPHGFGRTVETIDRVLAERSSYCDAFSVGCTVSKANVDHLVELDEFCRAKAYPVFYRLAVGNRRIFTDSCEMDFSVLADENALQSAQEFFYGKIIDRSNRNWREKLVYFMILEYLLSKGTVRLANCFWAWRDATIDESGKLYYCATQSESIGQLDGRNGRSLFFARDNQRYRKRLCAGHCSSCIHYAFMPTPGGLFRFALFAGRWVAFSRLYKAMRRRL